MRPRPRHGGELALQRDGVATEFLQVFAGEHELQRFTALALDHRVGRGENPRAGNLAQILCGAAR
jgi:hypothetical protein